MMHVIYLAVGAAALQAPGRRSHLTRRQIAPSGVDGLPEPLQAAVFLGCMGGIGSGTVACNAALDKIRAATQRTGAGAERWRKFVEIALSFLGLFYVVAGVGHFAAADAFRAITPPFGTWGLWPVPTAPAFHVAWTGLAEFVGGATLVGGGAASLAGIELEAPVKWLPPLAAAGLLLLMVAVTPANIYMYTHGATMGTPPLPLLFHYIRFAIQCVVLGLLATLAKDSFFYAWGDEIE